MMIDDKDFENQENESTREEEPFRPAENGFGSPDHLIEPSQPTFESPEEEPPTHHAPPTEPSQPMFGRESEKETTAPESDAPASPEKEEPKEENPSYEYVFSNGNFNQYAQPIPPKKGKGGKLSFLIIAVALFSMALTAAVILLLPKVVSSFDSFGTVDGEKSGELSGPGTQSSDPPLGKETNPDFIGEKSGESGSVYGSAGVDVLQPSRVVAMVEDAVVVINGKVRSTNIWGQQTEGTSSGSGVLISSDGYILTCNHVVSGASSVTVQLNSGKKYDAALVGADAASDLAVLKIDETNLVYVKQGCSADLVKGEYVIAIGNPLGLLDGTVTSGIISSKSREVTMEDGTVMNLIQTDAAINSGNSGGGLFNLQGELIGIVNSKMVVDDAEGLAFAIPIDHAYTVEEDLIHYGYVRGIVDDGMNFLDIDSSNINYYRFYYSITETGLYVLDSEFCTDLKNGDRIISVNGTKVQNEAQWDRVLDDAQIGDTILITYSRKGTEYTTALQLREYVPESSQNILK